jgi:hypothetical protein
MEIRPGARPATRLAAALAATAMTFTAGCAGPRPPRPPQFSPMPPPGQMENPGYTAILGPMSGSGSKTFTISARPGIAVWIGCIGKGMAWMKSPVAMGAVCGDGGVFVSGLTQPTHYRHGQKLTVRITAPATARWEFRIDGAPWTRS